MSADPTFWREWERKRNEQQAAARAEFFASDETIPPLDLMPDCPICGASCDVEDGEFCCRGCDVEWDRNGENGRVSS